MQTLIRTAVIVCLLGSGPLFSSGCASSGGAKASSGPVELNGTRWKMKISGGKIDGRMVEFKKKGEDGYIGNLVEPGIRLRDVVGLQSLLGNMVFSVRKKGVNEYEGMYKLIQPDGAIAEQEVVIFIDGDSMTWNLESAQWERVQ